MFTLQLRDVPAAVIFYYIESKDVELIRQLNDKLGLDFHLRKEAVGIGPMYAAITNKPAS